jgi:hypothetical protein
MFAAPIRPIIWQAVILDNRNDEILWGRHFASLDDAIEPTRKYIVNAVGFRFMGGNAMLYSRANISVDEDGLRVIGLRLGLTGNPGKVFRVEVSPETVRSCPG